MRILLAEDESELANWLVRALEQSGFQVDWVNDGRMVRVTGQLRFTDAAYFGFARQPGQENVRPELAKGWFDRLQARDERCFF